MISRHIDSIGYLLAHKSRGKVCFGVKGTIETTMRLSRYAKTQVQPVGFWLSVAVAVLLVSGIGLSVGQGWHTPGLSRWFWGGALLVIWVVSLIQLARYGRAAFSWQRAAFMIGYTLYAGGQLWFHPTRLVTWASNVGLCIVMASMLSPYFVFGKRRDDEAGPGTMV